MLRDIKSTEDRVWIHNDLEALYNIWGGKGEAEIQQGQVQDHKLQLTLYRNTKIC